MKDKIVFFILGALLATLAHFVGNIDTLTAEEKVSGIIESKAGTIDFLAVKNLVVSEGIVIGDYQKKGSFIILTNHDTGADIRIYAGNGAEDPSIVLRALKDRSLISTFSASETENLIGSVQLGTRKNNGKWISMMDMQDSHGKNAVATTGVVKK